MATRHPTSTASPASFPASPRPAPPPTCSHCWPNEDPEMNIGHYVAWFWGGAFLMNAVPHVVAGTMGRAFQSPFAKPPGEGLSSSTVNVLWGFLNAVVAWVLLVRV